MSIIVAAVVVVGVGVVVVVITMRSPTKRGNDGGHV